MLGRVGSGGECNAVGDKREGDTAAWPHRHCSIECIGAGKQCGLGAQEGAVERGAKQGGWETKQGKPRKGGCVGRTEAVEAGGHRVRELSTLRP